MMKWMLFAILACISFMPMAQGKKIETRQWVENGTSKEWRIVTEYDRNGKIVRTDSTYSEKDTASFDSGNFEFRFDAPAGSKFRFYNYQSDSTTQRHLDLFEPDGLIFDHFGRNRMDIEQILDNYQRLLEEQLDIYFDSIPPPDEFIFPDHSNERKI